VRVGSPRLSATLTVLDVGHGNSAVVDGPDGVVVIDAGPGGGDLLRYLREEHVDRIACIVISHVDADHLRGLLAVLAEPSVAVEQVRINPDAKKQSELWDDIAWTLDHLDQSGDCEFLLSCVRGDALPAVAPDVALEVVAPVKSLAAHGPGWTDPCGQTATTNTCSVVVRIKVSGAAAALLAADLDEMGLSYLLQQEPELLVNLLVFPHHGGNVRIGADGTANVGFAETLITATVPTTVIFSTGRGRHATPRPEIVAAVRARVADVRIACTQLSEHCRAEPINEDDDPPHLLMLHARGREDGSCCAGTMRWDLSSEIEPGAVTHQAFVASVAPTALCR
jgi:beta-lactamase superfamily II metal-dependent hydrolase